MNRIVREDNKPLNKTVVYGYDNNGNITERCEYAYTRKTEEELSETECRHYNYDYNGDKLVSYNGECFSYNEQGSPTVYRGKAVSWKYGRLLTGYNGVSFYYDCFGKRTQKGNVTYVYDNDGRLIKQSNGLEFIYDDKGVIGVKYNNAQYFYRRDARGNIIAVLDSNGNVVVKYIYDCWGNHAVVDKDGNDIEDTENIGNLNPFRYCGYYYDVETGFYYLNARYYDPEIGRFISQDDVDYADPETINGLNLYAYCANNPVMYFDPTGNSWKSFWNGVKRVVAGVVTVALTVGAVALTVVSGGIASPALAVVAQLGAAVLTGAAFGATLSLASQSNINTDFNLKSFFIDVGIGAVSGAFSFGVGKLFSAIGEGVGLYLNQITINSLQVGKVFGNILPKIFEKAGALIGGISSGMFIDKFASILLNRQNSILDRFTNNFQGGIFSSILEFIKSIW